MDASQIFNKYDNISDRRHTYCKTEMKWISKTENKIKCKIIFAKTSTFLVLRFKQWRRVQSMNGPNIGRLEN